MLTDDGRQPSHTSDMNKESNTCSFSAVGAVEKRVLKSW